MGWFGYNVTLDPDDGDTVPELLVLLNKMTWLVAQDFIIQGLNDK